MDQGCSPRAPSCYACNRRHGLGESRGAGASAAPLPARHRGVHPRTNGTLVSPGPSSRCRGDQDARSPGASGGEGAGDADRGGAATPRGARGAPHIRGSSGSSGGRGAAASSPRGAPGGRPGRWGWSGAPRGGGEGRAAAALICKQKERRDPNKSGRAGDIPALRTAPRTAPHRAAPLTWRTSLAT